MSAVETKSLKTLTPSSVLRSRVSPNLLRFTELKLPWRFQGVSPGSLSGYPGVFIGGFNGPRAILWIDSSFITSAPMSPSRQPQKGPAHISESSRALMPSKGLFLAWFILFPIFSNSIFDLL